MAQFQREEQFEFFIIKKSVYEMEELSHLEEKCETYREVKSLMRCRFLLSEKKKCLFLK
ncbi:hypothetical protein QPJ48_18115 [Clostridioides difficile]|nr:hypothetical protein [Clostridioides difficile]